MSKRIAILRKNSRVPLKNWKRKERMFFVLAFNKFSLAKLRFNHLKHHLALFSFLS